MLLGKTEASTVREERQMGAHEALRAWFGSPRRRSVAGLVIALAGVPLLLGIDNCSELKTPIGSPEQGWTDPRISGVWLLSDGDNGTFTEHAGTLWVFEPFDATTWLVTRAMFQRDVSAASPPAGAPLAAPEAAASGTRDIATSVPPDVPRVVSTLRESLAEPTEMGTFKGWLTSLGGRRYLVLQEVITPSSARGFRPDAWTVFEVSLENGRLVLSFIDTSIEHLDNVTSRARAEAIIARHAGSAGFSTRAFVLHPVPRASYDDAKQALARHFKH